MVIVYSYVSLPEGTYLVVKSTCFANKRLLFFDMVAAASSLFALKLWELLSVPPSFWHKIIQNHHPKHSKTASPIYGYQNNRQSFYKHPIKLKTGSRISIWFWVKITEAPRQKEIWVLNALIKLNNPPFLTPNSRATPNLSSGFCSVLRPCSHVAPRS